MDDLVVLLPWVGIGFFVLMVATAFLPDLGGWRNMPKAIATLLVTIFVLGSLG